MNTSVAKSFNPPKLISFEGFLLAVVSFVDFCDWLKRPMLPCLANKKKKRFLSQSGAKPKLTVTWAHDFPRALHRLRVFPRFTLRSLIDSLLYCGVVIGQL